VVCIRDRWQAGGGWAPAARWRRRHHV